MSRTKAIIRNEWHKRKWLYLMFLALFDIWIFLWIKHIYYDVPQLTKYGKYTVAEIIKYDRYGRSQPFTKYRYKIDNQTYEDSFAYWLTGCPSKNHCVGAKFKLKYSSKNPNIHHIFLEEQLNDSIPLGTQL